MSAKARILDVEFFSCFAHVLNLIVTGALSKLNVTSESEDIRFKTFIGKCRSLATLFNHSTNLNSQLLNDQRTHVPSKKPLRLVQDVVTRWNSLYLMLRRIVKIGASVVRVLNVPCNANYKSKILNDEEQNIISDVTKVLAPFFVVTQKLSAEKYVTRSIILPSIVYLYQETEIKPEESELIKNLKKELKTQMDSYFVKYKFLTNEKEIQPDLVCAAILNPKYKMLTIVKTSAKRSEYFDVAKQRISALSFPNNDYDIIENPEASFEIHLSEDGIQKNNPINFTTVVQELNNYLNISNKPKESVESFYSNNSEYKRLTECLDRFLLAFATSVPSERLFSHTEFQVINYKNFNLPI